MSYNFYWKLNSFLNLDFLKKFKELKKRDNDSKEMPKTARTGVTMTKTAKVTYFFFRPTVLHDHAASRLVKNRNFWLKNTVFFSLVFFESVKKTIVIVLSLLSLGDYRILFSVNDKCTETINEVA